jgi:hypothetical protein
MRRFRSSDFGPFDFGSLEVRPSVLSSAALAAALVLAGCSRPQMPEHDKPPQPQATAPAATAGARPGALADSIQRPIDRAEAAQSESAAAAERQREVIDAATGN